MTHLVAIVIEAIRRQSVLPILLWAPPIFQAETDLAEVLAPDAVAVPAYNFDPLETESERVVDLDFEFRFSGRSVDGSGFSARDPDGVEGFASCRRCRLRLYP